MFYSNNKRKRIFALVMTCLLFVNLLWGYGGDTVVFASEEVATTENEIKGVEELIDPEESVSQEVATSEEVTTEACVSTTEVEISATEQKSTHVVRKEKASKTKIKKTLKSSIKKETITKSGESQDSTQEEKEEEGKPAIKLQYESGSESPKKTKEVWKEGQNPVMVYYFHNSAKLSVGVKGDDYQKAKIHIGTSVDGNEMAWTTHALAEKETSIAQTFAEEGKYEVSVWIEKEDGSVVGKNEKTGQIDASNSFRFVIDKVAPVLALNGVSDGQVSKDYVTFSLSVNERYHDYEQYQLFVTRRTVDGIHDEEVMVFQENEWMKTENGLENTVSFSEEGNYEIEFVGSDMAGNKAATQKLKFVIDGTAPEITGVVYSDDRGFISPKYESIFSNQYILVEMSIKDNVSEVDPKNVYVTIGDDTKKKYTAKKVLGDVYSVLIPTDLKLSEFKDKITIWAKDASGNQSTFTSLNLIFNTSRPSVVMKSDRKIKKWTKKNITFETTITDEKSGLKEIIYTVNDEEVKKVQFSDFKTTYSYDVVAKDNAEEVQGYKVCVEAVNNCGNRTVVKKTVYIDKEKPIVQLSGVKNGEHYNKSPTIVTNVSDVSYKDTNTVYMVKCVQNGVSKKIALADFHSKDYEDTCTRAITQEGKYEIYAITTDGAGNRTESNKLEFVVDFSAPQLSITGVEDGTVSASSVDLTFSCDESFYDTNDVRIEVNRKLDGKTISEQIDALPKNQKNASVSQTFSKDGVYEVSMSAKDRAGNVSETKKVTFSIDQTKPIVSIRGTDNYQLWDESPTLEFVVEESFYNDDTVKISGTKTDIDGNVEDVELPRFVSTGIVSSLAKTFVDEGIYDLVLSAKDKAGNQASNEIHFTVDHTKPMINGVKTLDGGYYQEFQLAESLDGMFKDLTVISYRMLLNGIEYDGVSPVTDEGKYTLELEVSDELGHIANEMIEFIVDRTAPKVIFSGVKDGEFVKEPGTVEIALMDEQDEITEVRLNGVACDTGVRSISYTDYGTYQIEVDCIDKAGNVATRSIQFEYKNPIVKMILICCLAMIIVAGCGWLCFKAWKKNGKVSAS
ncbi:MAG: Ig-like domain-containing protein [Eubacteriales bacterium]|nr:Ig-like domain-containing protein [Eubacteriales bacterium]